MVRCCRFLVLLGAFGGCTANAGGSSGEPDTADSVTTPATGATSERDAATPTSNTTEAPNGQASTPSGTERGEPTATSDDAATSDDTATSDDGAGTNGQAPSANVTEPSETNATVVDAGGAKPSISCDAREVNCERVEPTCDYGYVPRIVDGCFAECVRIDACVCSGPDECPQHERYTCNNSRQRCTPYLN